MSNTDELSQAGAFSKVWHELSSCVRNAMTVAKEMGEKYIWIDSLCIQQDRIASDKGAQDMLEAMDSIYRHAAFVLIAADDRAPEKGLAGVSSRPRQIRQHIAVIAPGVKVLARFDHQAYLQRSRWRTRAWTYQEEEMATRSLVFINDQMYFTCPQAVYVEDVVTKSSPHHDETLIFQQRSARSLDPVNDPTDMYFRSVETYTQRALTCSGDILRAFAGMAAMQSQILSCELIQGLPTRIFDMALLWQPVQQLKRRSGFPSW